MKHRGGVPKAFQKERRTTAKINPSTAFVQKNLPLPEKPAGQMVKSGISQLLKRPTSPFTGPGPSTAGRRRKTRKIKRRS